MKFISKDSDCNAIEQDFLENHSSKCISGNLNTDHLNISSNVADSLKPLATDAPDSLPIKSVTFKESDNSESLLIDINVNEKSTIAVVDTGAQVTVMSYTFANSLKNIQITKQVKLKAAGNDQYINANFCPSVTMTIGTSKITTSLYIGNISDNVILGLDVLRNIGAKINLENSTLTLQNTPVYSSGRKTINENTFHRISQVIVKKRHVIPPNTVMRIPCKLNNRLEGDFDFVPDYTNNKLFLKVLIPNMVFRSNNNATCLVCFTNDSDKYVTIKKDTTVGTASEIIEVINPVDSHKYDLENSFMVNNENETLTNHNSTPNVNRIIHEQSKHTSDDDMPDHIVDMFNRSITNLNEDETAQFKHLLLEYVDIFSKDDTDIGHFKGIKFKIDTGNESPVQHRIRRTPLGFENEEEKHLKSMLKSNVIQPSTSEWASAPVLVRKKDGGVRWCIDYRDLNNRTRSDQYRVPLISECIDTLSGFQFLSCLDLASGYWQCEIDEKDRHKTAFITKFGLFEHIRMGFGFKNAPAFFQRVMELVLRGLTWKEVLVYLDDVVIVGDSFDHHLQNIREVFQRFRTHNLKLKPKKCTFFQTKVKFLGRTVSKAGVEINPDSIDSVRKWKTPANKKDVERFLGFLNYHRDFIKEFAHQAEPLYRLTGKNDFHWGHDEQSAFENLKMLLTTTPVLAYPNSSDVFILDTDASNTAIGAELSQLQDGKERVVSYGSYSLTPQQRRYCTTRKELLAIVRFTRQYRHYLLGKKFYIRTDHSSLSWLMRFKMLDGQLARWLEELSQFDMEIIHRSGKKHINADALSRLGEDGSCDCYKAGVDISLLPCGGCKYCKKYHDQWEKFELDVDDVMPLSIRSIALSDSWLPNYCTDDIKSEQHLDKTLLPILTWLETNQDPDEGEYFLTSRATKYYWSNKEFLELRDGILYWKWINDTHIKYLLIVPSSMKQDVLSHCHNDITSGHMGRKRTTQIVRRSFHWFGLTKDTHLFVKTCDICNLNKKPKNKAKARQISYHSGYPMERVHIDILGPFKPSRSGNIYVLVMVDQFTKWVECQPLADQTAERVATAAVNDFFSRFGCPTYLHTDQGKNFDGKLFNDMCKLLRIVKQRTTPYRPNANGQVERYNRTLLQLIRCYLQDNHSTWDENLQLLCAAIRSTVNRSIQQTPNMMMLGREVSHPHEIMLGLAQINKTLLDPDAHIIQLKNTLEKVHHLARDILKHQQVIQKRYYDSKLHEKSFQVGDLVYLLNSATKIGQINKLKPIYKGPYVIIKCLSNVLYQIGGKQKKSTVHHDRLIPCEDRNIPIWVKRLRHKVLSGKSDITHHEPLEIGKDDLCLDKLFEKDIETETLDSNSHDTQAPINTRRGREIRIPRYLRDYAS